MRYFCYQKAMNTLIEPDVRRKIQWIEDSCQKAYLHHIREVPVIPARDIQVLHVKNHPPKKGFSYKEGQARLLHDLGNIELQAMELGLRTLIEFPEAPKLFREQLIEVILSEAKHLKLCLDGIEQLGFKWGDWPIHVGLWETTSEDDSLLDRILIVHRYLEGSGLDAGDTLIHKLHGTHSPIVTPILKVIVEEEVGHVLFGSVWYKKICAEHELDPSDDFPERMIKISHKIPKRLEKMNRALRKAAGFDEIELDFLEKFQDIKKQMITGGN
jgi:uncharacterized ferritin-like protein (DUF455 family)